MKPRYIQMPPLGLLLTFSIEAILALVSYEASSSVGCISLRGLILTRGAVLAHWPVLGLCACIPVAVLAESSPSCCGQKLRHWVSGSRDIRISLGECCRPGARI